jgi:hypothetical protein
MSGTLATSKGAVSVRPAVVDDTAALSHLE